MTKKDIIAQIALDTGVNKVQAGAALNSILNSIILSLSHKEKITFVGFGTFSVTERDAYIGHNPATGESIQIPAKHIPRFKAGQQLKSAV